MSNTREIAEPRTAVGNSSGRYTGIHANWPSVKNPFTAGPRRELPCVERNPRRHRPPRHDRGERQGEQKEQPPPKVGDREDLLDGESYQESIFTTGQFAARQTPARLTPALARGDPQIG